MWVNKREYRSSTTNKLCEITHKGCGCKGGAPRGSDPTLWRC